MAASIFCILFVLLLISDTNYAYGFSIDLIHKDSPNSPFYNPSETQFERLRNTVRRSFNRINHFNRHPTVSLAANGLPTSSVFTNEGDYVMNLTIGSPPVQIIGVADTGSHLIWTQCQPCEHCYPQTNPIFDPKASSTYKEVACDSPSCGAKVGGGDCKASPKCLYNIKYNDNSFSKGVLATDTITLGSVSFTNTIFGCGTNNDGILVDNGGIASGVIGLSGWSTSLISQMGPSINGKFSYCLVPRKAFSEGYSSKMSFGTDAIVTGQGVVTTKITQKPNVPFYYLTLLAISVGSEKIDFAAVTKRPVPEGNIIIDSGTTLTILPTDVFNKVVEAVTRQVQKPKADDPSKTLKSCFLSQDDFIDQALTFHFDGGDLNLTVYNSFLRMTKDITCLALNPNDQLSIFGNMAQMNVLVGYDLQANTVALKGTDCTMP